MFEKGRRIIQIPLKAGFFFMKQSQEIQVLGIKWHDAHFHILLDVINKITDMCPPINKKETQAFLDVLGF